MKKIISLCVLLIGILPSAFGASFNYRIIHPDGEEKSYVLPEKASLVQLSGSKWECMLEKHTPKVFKGITLTTLMLTCAHGKADTRDGNSVAIPLSCDDTTSKVSVVHLQEKGEKRYILSIECNH